MGTRGDFYIGRGTEAEWLGSVAFDAYPHGVDAAVLKAKDEASFKAALTDYFQPRDDVTLPEMGWPWPWETSHTTDFAYAFDDGQVYGSCFGGAWFKADESPPDFENDEDSHSRAVFPDMTERKTVTYGKRSGFIVLGG